MFYNILIGVLYFSFYLLLYINKGKTMNNIYDINELIRKYISNVLTADELMALRQAVQESSDNEIASILEKEWNSLKVVEPINESIRCQMFAKIESQIGLKQYPIRRFGRNILKYASIVLLLVLSVLSLYLFIDNRQMTALTANQISVKTATGERTTVKLPDGTTVRLNGKSELDYKQDFGLKNRQVQLTGEGFFSVAHNAEKKFIVNTKFIDIEVFGTQFNVYSYENKDKVEMALVKGHVKVVANRPPYQVLDVHPNQKIVYEKRSGKMQLIETDNQLETAWMTHDLVFRSEPLKTVLECIARKFGLSIHTDRTINLNDTYTGMFDETNIREVIQILSIHYGFNYQIRENTIYIGRAKKI